MKGFLDAWGVLPLFSPPRTPEYNGACEAGNGALNGSVHDSPLPFFQAIKVMLSSRYSTPRFVQDMWLWRLLIPCLFYTAVALGHQPANTVDTAEGWGDIRLLDSTWRQFALAIKPNEPEPTRVGVFAAVIDGKVPSDYQYALMLKLTSGDTRLPVSKEFLETAPAGFSELFANRGDRAALVTALSRSCQEKINGVPVGVWLAPQQFDLVSVRVEKSAQPTSKILGLPNGILVLCDAFDQSTSKEVRSVISRALKIAFDPHLTWPTDESKTATVCREWFSRHHTEFYVTVAAWHPGHARRDRSLQVFRPSKERR